jgi:hypothetical protein
VNFPGIVVLDKLDLPSGWQGRGGGDRFEAVRNGGMGGNIRTPHTVQPFHGAVMPEGERFDLDRTGLSTRGQQLDMFRRVQGSLGAGNRKFEIFEIAVEPGRLCEGK